MSVNFEQIQKISKKSISDWEAKIELKNYLRSLVEFPKESNEKMIKYVDIFIDHNVSNGNLLL